MEKMKKVSIILPVYNGEAHVSKAIESVLAQTYSCWELIIVNDCSSDHTGEVAASYASRDSRIRILHNHTNQKLPRSLNIGFSHASGDYYTWTSDDNQFHPDAIEKMVQAIESSSDIDLVYADYSIVNMDGSLIREIKSGEPHEIFFHCVVGACFLYTKELAQKAGSYDPDMFLAEDYEYWIRCYQYGKFLHIPENLYAYGRHENNLSATRQKEIRRQAYRVMNIHYDFLISLCTVQSDRNQYYWTALGLIDDPSQRQDVRKKYYTLDPAFQRADRRRRLQRSVRHVLRLPVRALRKGANYIKKG